MSLTSYQNRDINPLANLSDFIWSKEKSLSESFCENMIEKFDESDHQQYDGVIGTGQTDPVGARPSGNPQYRCHPRRDLDSRTHQLS